MVGDVQPVELGPDLLLQPFQVVRAREQVVHHDGPALGPLGHEFGDVRRRRGRFGIGHRGGGPAHEEHEDEGQSREGRGEQGA